MAEMMSNLRFSTTMTGADLARVTTASEHLLKSVLIKVTDKIKDYFDFKSHDLDDEKNSFINQFSFHSFPSKFSSIAGQIKAIKNKYKYIEPTEVFFGQKVIENYNKSTATVETEVKDVSFQYIPLTKTLEMVLSNDEVFEYVTNSYDQKSDSSIITSYKDGENYKNNPLFKKYKNAIALYLYFDDFLVNNPLGSKTREQKLSALYFSIANVEPHLKDFLGNVHVLALAHCENVKQFGINKLLSPFVHELKQLEKDEGVPIKIHNTTFILRASLLNLCSDTLAAHEVFRLLSPSANLFCRSCIITSQERVHCPYTVAPLRNPAMHQEYIEEITVDKSAESRTGVHEDSVLNELKYFHITNNLTFDAMHDVLEGHGQFILKLIMAHYVSEKIITIDCLNYRIKHFSYGVESKNKPSANITAISLKNVATDHNLHQRAAQTWCLLRVFPFIISDKVSCIDKYFQYLLNHNKITEIIFAPKSPVSIGPYLNELIKQQYDDFPKLFPGIKRINKFYHYTHFWECILRNGPLSHLTCFRYEAKHQLFIKYGNICNNFKNITKTMTNISQLSQCSIWGTSKTPIRNKLLFFSPAEVFVKNTTCKNCFINLGFSEDAILKKINHIQIYSASYAVDEFVVIQSEAMSDTNMPDFAKISEIFVIDENVYLYCTRYITQYLDELLNSYHITKGKTSLLIDVNDLCDTKTYSTWKDYRSDLEYICLKYILL